MTLDWSNFHEGGGNVNGEIGLIGFDSRPNNAIKLGSTIEITLYWKVLKQPTQDYQVFVQLLSTDFTQKIAGVNMTPFDPYKSTLALNRPSEVLVGRTYK